jgi:hypothetical protein
VPGESDEKGVGIVDFANDRSHVTLRMVTERMHDDSRRRDTPLAQRMKRAMSGSVELLYDSGRRYVRTAAGNWDPTSDDEPPGRPAGDPLWMLAVLAGAMDDVTIIGDGEVRGTLTERQRLTVDFRRAHAATPRGLREPDLQPRRWYQRRPQATAPHAIPVEVWLDDAQRIRRVSLAPLIRRDSDEQVLWAILELWDFGRAPVIAPPG